MTPPTIVPTLLLRLLLLQSPAASLGPREQALAAPPSVRSTRAFDGRFLVLNPALATLRTCNATTDPGQGWHWEGEHVLSDGRNGNDSAPNWKLPDCGWCLAIDTAAVSPTRSGSGATLRGGQNNIPAPRRIRKAHCCTRATCLHRPYPMCANASSTVAAGFKVRSDGRLMSDGSCIGAAGQTAAVGSVIGTLDCNQRNATFIVFAANERPHFRAEAAATNLCLGTGIPPGVPRPHFHCEGERCVPGGDCRVSYLDPHCFAQCNTSTTLKTDDGGASNRPFRWTMAPALAPFAQLQAYYNTSMTTFGGGIVHWPGGVGGSSSAGGSFHLFATGLTRGCGVHAWSSNAKVVHLVSSTPQGPYIYANDALPVLAAAPGIARSPDGTFLLFSMGVTNSSLEQDCPGGEPVHRREQVVWDVRLHSAQSPYGPWTAVKAGPNGSAVLWSAVNPTPSPWVLPNGTVVVIGGGLWIADTWRGPYRKVPGPPIKARYNMTRCSADPRAHRSAAAPASHCAAEDPFLFFAEQEQRWIYLEHQKLDDAVVPRDPHNPTGHLRQCDFFPYVTGFAESTTADLWGRWRYDFYRPAVGLYVRLSNQSAMYCLGKRERPKIFQWRNRTYLLNVVAPDDLGAHMGRGDRGTFTFIQEVLSMGNVTDEGMFADQ
jgi:hypothetical protein